MERKNFKQAEAKFRQVLEKNPHSVQSHGNLGIVYGNMGMKTAALARLDQALAIDPNYEPAQINRGLIETMIEGQPMTGAMAEVNYYADMYKEKASPLRICFPYRLPQNHRSPWNE